MYKTISVPCFSFLADHYSFSLLILCSRYLLITKQWEEEARKALRRLRASNQVEEDIEEMRAEERAQQAESRISMTELICSPTLRAPLVIGVVMQLSQQLSGINAVSIVVYKFHIPYYCLHERSFEFNRRTCAAFLFHNTVHSRKWM